MSIWANTLKFGKYVNANRVKQLLENTNLVTAGEALDFLSGTLSDAPTKNALGELRVHMAQWTAERLRASIFMLVVNGAPMAAIFAERALAGVETQLVFKAKPEVQQNFLAGSRVDNEDRKEVSYRLDAVKWLRNAIWPKPPRRGEATTSDLALTVAGDESPEDSDVARAIAMLTREQLDLVMDMVGGIETRAQAEQLRSRFQFGLLDEFRIEAAELRRTSLHPRRPPG